MKRHFITGLALLLPLVFTLWIISFLFDLFTAPFVGIMRDFLRSFEDLYHIPENLSLFLARLCALVLLTLSIFTLGVIARWFLWKQLLACSDAILSKIPVVKWIYKTSQDLFSALFSSEGKKAFKRPVLLPFPFPPSQAIGFEAGEVPQECQEKIATPLTSVFMPTSPHPIAGFLFLVPKENVHDVAMNNEEALKFLVSCGMIHPDNPPQETDAIL